MAALRHSCRGCNRAVTGIAPSVRLWLERDDSGTIVGSTGYEISEDGQHALIRSVAVSQTQRSCGRGSALASFALERAVEEGASRAWLFSRRSAVLAEPGFRVR